MQDLDTPLVSVRTITYNHAPYIQQCIEGVLMQKTNFRFEYLIGEDCSSDGTREIVFEYAEKYPEIIRVITSENNVGAKTNAKRLREACHGKYQALCEGDDYWTDPYKLQKQVDFLKRHIDCSMCFHRASRVDESGKSLGITLPNYHINNFTGIKDLLFYNYISTQTCMYRSGLFDEKEFIHLSAELYFSDWVLHVLNAKHGKIGFIDEIMAVYRVTATGANLGTPLTKHYQDRLIFQNRLESYLGPNYNDAICNGKMFTEAEFAISFAQAGDISFAKEALKQSLSIHTLNYQVNKARLKAILQIYFSSLYDTAKIINKYLTKYKIVR